MATIRGKVMAGATAQMLAQATAIWSLVIHFLDWQNASVWVAAPLVAAIVVPFRHDGSLKDRATSNFGAALIVAGLMWWEVALGGLDGLLGGTGFSLGVVAMLLLASTVLFALAGAMFWILRSEGWDA